MQNKSDSDFTQLQILQLISIVEKQSPFSSISRYEEEFLQKSLQKRIQVTHCKKPEEYIRIIDKSLDEANALLDSLQNSYSEFFRNQLTFSVLERNILPAIILRKIKSKQKEIRIWSAACAAGQEVYSLAMLLEELKNGNTESFSYRIFATDQSEIPLNKAQTGIFSSEALNNMNLKRVKQWFSKYGDSYLVNQELKNRIDFSVFDLFSKNLSSPPASIFGDFDLIFCANLLFYYQPASQKLILEKTRQCLADGGYLISGETEREIVLGFNYQEVFPHSAIFQRSNGSS